MGFHIEDWLRGVPKNKEGLSVKEIKNEIKNFFGRSKSDKSEKGEIDSNGGFLDIVRYIKEDLREKGMDENVTEEEFKDLVYDSIQTLWENQVCIKGNIIENEDYSYETDYNYSRGGKEKVKMSKMDMHTFKDRTIDTEKLEVMVDDKGKPMTMFEVYKNMAKYYKKEDQDKRLHVRVSESYDYNEKTGEWEVIGYNYAEDYITTLTERDKEKHFSEENEKKRKELENEESNLPIKKGFFDRVKEKIYNFKYNFKKWIKGKISKDNIEDVELEEKKQEENVIKEEKDDMNYKKITNSEILQNEAVKEKIEEYMKNLNDKVKNSNNTQKHDKDLDR